MLRVSHCMRARQFKFIALYRKSKHCHRTFTNNHHYKLWSRRLEVDKRVHRGLTALVRGKRDILLEILQHTQVDVFTVVNADL